MNVTATVEVTVRQVFSLPEYILTVNSMRDAMKLNFGELSARTRHPTATFGLINPLMRPMVGVSPQAIVWVALEGSVRYSTKVTNVNSLWVILNLRVRSILESYPIPGSPRGLQYPYFRGPRRPIYVVILAFRSIWELQKGIYIYIYIYI